MVRHLQREIDKLKRKILALSALVEERLRQAFAAVEQRDGDLATRVIAGDRDIDLEEIEVEEDCLKVLALYQPVAIDLRYLVAIIKINNELERIGDGAGNIAERALALAEMDPVQIPDDLFIMAERVETMLRQALDALVNVDGEAARQVLSADDEVDDLYRDVLEQLKGEIRRDIGALDALVHVFSVARYLERLADHATNIAEDVIYMAEGDIVRHGIDNAASEATASL